MAELKVIILVLLLFQSFLIENALSYGKINSTDINILPNCKDNPTLIRGVSCKDLIDLPLCKLFSPIATSSTTPPFTPSVGITVESNNVNGTVNNPNINCTRECSEIDKPASAASGGRGDRYAIHNVDCIRFCPTNGATSVLEKGETVSWTASERKCVLRKCHQLPTGTDPIESGANKNCQMVGCNVLTTEELAEKFSDNVTPKFGSKSTLDTLGINRTAKKYCNANNVKCYNFSKERLPYLFYDGPNKPTSMCQIHNCDLTAELRASCGAGQNDSLNITSKGDAYIAAYKTHIDNQFGLKSGDTGYNANLQTCTPLTCEPIFYNPIRCTNDASGEPKIKAAICVTDCDNNGFCKEKIDCNIPENKLNNIQCQPASEIDNSAVLLNSTEADLNLKSWFFRPSPPTAPSLGTNLNKTDMCYTEDDMQNNGWGETTAGDVFWHFYTRSPGSCYNDFDTMGGPVVGYNGLCGVDSWIYNKASNEATYNYGYAKANYTATIPEYSISTCVRYVNSGRHSACGRRSCNIDVAFDDFTDWCGRDACKTLKVTGTGKACNKPGGDESDCYVEMDNTGLIGGYTRLRAVKYPPIVNKNLGLVTPSRLCTFLDLQGTLAYNPQYFDGSETLSDGTCVDGTSTKAPCNGHNSNDNEGLAFEWRTVKIIDHVDKDYTDFNGHEFKKQQCAYIPLRIGPPRWYSVANESNSVGLFTPPIWISSIHESKFRQTDSTTGRTDFNYPSIEVTFGDVKAKLSLDMNKTGFESDREEVTLVTTLNNVEQPPATLFIRKEFDPLRKEPTLCLYRLQLTVNREVFYKSISCIDRERPEIDGKIFGIKRKTIITAPTTNTYNNAKLELKLAVFGANENYDNCSNDDTCTSVTTFDNTSPSNEVCKEIGEKYNVCAKKEPCSELFNECIANEIDLAALNPTDPTYPSLISKKTTCDTILLKKCNQKWGIPDNKIDNVSDFIADIPALSKRPASAEENAYGWFNEICITKGFETKLKRVQAYKSSSGRGKCMIDNSKSNNNTSGNNCADGGNANKGCYCIETESYSAADLGLDTQTEEIRVQTPREAGLCIDIPDPKICPAINYGRNINNPNDLYYINGSVNKDTSLIHQSHKDRTAGGFGNAEFGATFSGVNDFKGSCNGFWKNQSELKVPTMSCNANGTWNTTNFQNSCIRYSCPQQTTEGMIEIKNNSGNDVVIYEGDYAIAESGDSTNSPGSWNGFANWNLFTKTNDSPQNVTASSCIPGFKQSAAGAPKRLCNQLGQWQEVTNKCERIVCKAPVLNKNETTLTQNDLNAWGRYGGAVFTEDALASRSNAPDSNTSTGQKIIGAKGEITTIQGTCYDGGPNSRLRFFQQGNNRPTMSCDSNGNWGRVENPCVTTCNAITETDADASSGFALWDEVTDVPINGQKQGVFKQCKNGYIKNPYPYPIYNSDGSLKYPNGGWTYPTDAQATPQKICTSVATLNDPNKTVWEATINSCVNTCPGADENPTPGIGITKHPTSRGEISIRWRSEELGKTQIYSSSDDLTATNFQENRNNNDYLLKRTCGNDGKWQNPVVLCSAKRGEVGNAYYENSNSNLAVGTSLAGTCKENYSNSPLSIPNAPAQPPYRNCSYKNSNNNIDEVFWKLVPPYNDCGEITCDVQASTLNGNNYSAFEGYDLIYSSQTRTLKDEETINLQCDTRQGSYQEGGNPYAKCIVDNINKTSSLAVYNSSSCKKGCSFSAVGDFNIDPTGTGDWRFGLAAFSMRAGQTVSFSGIANGSLDCETWRYKATCSSSGVSSVFSDVQDLRNDSDQCFYWDWNNNGGTTTWTESITRFIYSSQYYIDLNGVQQNIADKTKLTTW